MTKTGHSSILISDYIIQRHGCNFTPFQLIKFVFIAHGRTLAVMKRPLVRDRIEAWTYGPVIPLLYHQLKIWGDQKVSELNYCGTIPTKDKEVDSERLNFFQSILSKEEQNIIDSTVKEYKDWSFQNLQRLCHEPNSPWDKHYNGKLGTEIPDSTIAKYYTNELILVD